MVNASIIFYSKTWYSLSFNFEKKHFRIIFAPPYACIFMDKVETEFLDKGLLNLWVWLRYIDDISFVWTHGEESLQQFLEHLNDFHRSLRFTSEISAHHVNFLDVIVKLQKNEVLTDLYCKKTDCHQYLHYDSCHPEHMKKSSVHSQGLRIKRLCSDSENCETHLKNLKNGFMTEVILKILSLIN